MPNEILLDRAAHSREAEEMVSPGREAVLQHDNWEREAEGLRSTDHELLKD